MLIADVIHDVAVVRQSGAAALSAILAENPEELDSVLEILFAKYQDKLVVRMLSLKLLNQEHTKNVEWEYVSHK